MMMTYFMFPGNSEGQTTSLDKGNELSADDSIGDSHENKHQRYLPIQIYAFS